MKKKKAQARANKSRKRPTRKAVKKAKIRDFDSWCLDTAALGREINAYLKG